MNEPLISVVTISFNVAPYIERTLQSVATQTYPNIEYIVIDGASTDGTPEIIERYRDQIDVYVHEPDESLYDGMNKGLENASGEYIIFMNAGDQFARPTSLAEITKDSSNADFLYSRATYVDEEGNRTPWHKTTPLPNELSPESFIHGSVICHQCIVARRAICPKFLTSPWKISSDIDWTIRVLQQAKSVHFLDDEFCLFQKGGVSKQEWKLAVWERMQITSGYFGWPKTLIVQVKVGLLFIWKNLIGSAR